MLVLRAEECLLCLALDAVEDVFEQPVEEGTRLASLDVVDWPTVSGVGGGGDGEASRASSLVVVRTPAGPIGLAVDACLGVRELSLLSAPPIPTRMVDGASHPLCYLLMVERQPHFLIEPGALVQARNRVRGSGARPEAGASAAPPQPAVGGS